MKKLLRLLLFLTILTPVRLLSQCAGCPTVNAQVATGPATYICLGQSANLTASSTPVLGANTSSYSVSSIPYAPQPYAGGAIGVNNCDDCWGSVQNIPFNFCYYGNSFNQFVVGSNGMVTFNTAMALGFCAWPIPGPWPSIAGCGTGNVIGVPWRDINMSNGTAARWYVSGVTPNRTLVIYYQNVPLFSCGNPTSYLQLILYEGTQVIEVHIQNSSNCAWNNGAGICGVQNATGLIGTIAPLRNYPPGGWTAINEAWRFSPSPAVPSWTWTSPAGVVGTGTAVTVTPTITTTYTAYCVAGCPGGTVQVVVNNSPTVNPTNNSPICQGSQLNLLAGGGGANTTYTWTGPGGFTSGSQNPTLAIAQPSNSGVYSLIASNNFTAGPSCISNLGQTTVNVVPVNQITVTPTFTLCQGSNLNLTAVNAVPPTSYTWTGPNTFTSSLQNPTIPNVTSLNSGNYIAVASFSTPNIPLVCTSSAVTNVSVVTTSPLTVTIPGNICEHANANIIVSSNPVAMSYVWTGPNGFNATGTNTFINNIPAAASGQYSVVATWAIGTVSCTMGNTGFISVVPVAPISINQPISVCYPGNVALTASSQGAISYSWNASNGFTTNLQNPYFAAPSTTLSGTYTVTTAYTNGALVCYNSNTTQVNVNPIIDFSLEPYRQVCPNSIYSINGPNGATSYTWMNSGNTVSNIQNLTIPSIQPANSGIYTLIVSLGGCTTTASTHVDVLSLISFTQTPGNKIICLGDKVTLNMGAAGGSENYAYNWNPYTYLVGPTGSVQTNIQPQGTTIYNVNCYDIACPNYTISTGFTVTVNKAPTPNLKLDNFSGCEPLCLTYNSHTQSDASEIMYDFGKGIIFMTDSFNYCLDNGVYNLNIKTTGKNGCVATYTLPSTINVWPTPHTDLKWSPEIITTVNNHVTFEPSHEFGPVVKYQWEFAGADSSISSLKNPVRIYENVGKFQVMVISTTDKGCIDTSFKIMDVRDEFNIFIPNTFTPNGDGLNDTFNVKGLGLKTEGFSMEIYDRWGTMIYTSNSISKGWDGTVKGLYAENGVYVYKIKAVGANGEGRKEYVGHVSLLK